MSGHAIIKSFNTGDLNKFKDEVSTALLTRIAAKIDQVKTTAVSEDLKTPDVRKTLVMHPVTNSYNTDPNSGKEQTSKSRTTRANKDTGDGYYNDDDNPAAAMKRTPYVVKGS